MRLDATGVAFLLDVFCNESDMVVRVRSAEVMARMMADRLVGGRVRIQMLKFLPALFGDAMRDTPSIAVQLLESTSETPELIWTEEMRARLSIVFSFLLPVWDSLECFFRIIKKLCEIPD